MSINSYRYEQIKGIIADFLEDYQVQSLPIDVFEIATKMNIKLVFAKQLIRENPKKFNEYLLYQYPHSFMVYDPRVQQFVVYIDDLRTKKQRQRFSLAHEIMHIILGHSEQNKANETEANFGATYLLAPTSLVLIDINSERMFQPKIIAKIFNVSTQESAIISKYNYIRATRPHYWETNYEKRINHLLKESLLKKLEDFK